MRPAGPLPAAVYWRRRAVVLLVVLVLLSLLLRAFTGGGDEPGALQTTAAPTATDPSAVAPTPTPSSTPTGIRSPSASPTPADPARCDPSTLTVTTQTDKTSYPLEGAAGLTLAVTSSAAAPCTRPTGNVLTVTSGSDRIWSSEDCTPLEPAEPAQTLPPGRTVVQETAWDKVRSLPGCPSGLPELKPGTYVLSGRLGELSAQSSTFQLG